MIKEILNDKIKFVFVIKNKNILKIILINESVINRLSEKFNFSSKNICTYET
jgi:hypothetical protein